MEFINDIFTLQKPSKVKFELIGTKLPSSNDLFFRSKQEELIEQYSAARIFMHETETDDWNHWFNPVDDERAEKAFHLIFRSHFYETALFYYNAVVDISWALCYVAIEFACNKKGTRVNISGMKTIEEAAELLRSAERNVTSPTAEENPFEYLKMMCPEFTSAIDQIVGFWNQFAASNIRKRYNFCKHKGRPAYSEIEKLKPGKVMGVYVENKSSGEKTQIASDISDVKYEFSLEEAICELQEFDDNILFPYIASLIKTIEDILDPSPMVF
ncbi:hypothetical protein [Eubacterium aggregans]|uniref:hypothetical protein n=1 Tax=Eubacterium aggregans TaxID=81409 RepID=UPI0023F14DA4|nr:hypothetical protein [Eubacterium aggregans]MDD4691870.1 hypothetical protein [Eubacterium aggregans]